MGRIIKVNVNKKKAVTKKKKVKIAIKKVKKKDVILDKLNSWIGFNYRVLELASDKNTPLLERCKFIKICDTNLSEFLSTKELSNKDVQKNLKMFQSDMHRVYTGLVRDLDKKGLRVYDDSTLPEKHISKAEKIFNSTIKNVVQTMRLDVNLPMPVLSYNRTHLIINTTIKNEMFSTLVKIPDRIPKMFKIEENSFIDAVSLVKLFLDKIMDEKPNKTVAFRALHEVNNVNGYLKSNYIDQVKDEMNSRNTAPIKYFVSDDNINYQNILSNKVVFTLVRKKVDYTDLADLCDLVSNKTKSKYLFENQSGVVPSAFKGNIISSINKGDLLVQYPYQSFEDTFVRLLNQAASDPDVVSIKQTLYRVSKNNSSVVNNLILAANNGVDVTVMIELKAKFDEQNNLAMLHKMENAGITILHGITSMKIHCKLCSIVKNTKDGLIPYSVIATGNFSNTARFYEDLALYTCDKKIGSDIANLFNYISGTKEKTKLARLLASPTNMRSELLNQIVNCTKAVQDGKKAKIITKMNGLTDKGMIYALWNAAESGVDVQIICRGMNSMKYHPKMRVRSVVGRYLEHSRVYAFTIDKKTNVYLGSADLMTRNLDRRVEVLTPVRGQCKKKLLNILDKYLKDDKNSFILCDDNEYRRVFNKKKYFDVHASLRKMHTPTTRRLAI